MIPCTGTLPYTPTYCTLVTTLGSTIATSVRIVMISQEYYRVYGSLRESVSLEGEVQGHWGYSGWYGQGSL